ncbi:mannonate dehydratase [Polaribacter reichenbachii]|uniref:mannonate dehydratase n=1 Tax=Polaribacter reichenbachii TaxID=996801 RepID=UPI000B0D475D|nr:mannonate dehydratase [Polaribacter reichenbachii]
MSEIIPTAEAVDVNMAIHPDDPPFSVLGLPRVVSTQKNLDIIFQSVPSVANGLCYCTGSLGAEPNNDLLKIIDDFSDRIHFLHIRNVKRENKDVFRESEHLIGDNQIGK